MILDLTHLDNDCTGTIKEIKNCCDNFIAKFHSMGIRTGKIIKKVSGQKYSGPQIIRIDNLQIAIGYKMAKHILVEVEK